MGMFQPLHGVAEQARLAAAIGLKDELAHNESRFAQHYSDFA